MAKTVRMWGGYVNNKLDAIEVDTGWGGFGTGDRAKMPAIFTSLKAAKARYDDVRILLIPAPAKH